MQNICDTCGNSYEMPFRVIASDGREYTFDCFECAVTMLAPTCSHCGCRVIGHGVSSIDETVCCCDRCAVKHESHGNPRIRSNRHDDRMRDEALVESFPASDPPAKW